MPDSLHPPLNGSIRSSQAFNQLGAEILVFSSNRGALFPLFFTAASATLLGKWMKQMAGDCA